MIMILLAALAIVSSAIGWMNGRIGPVALGVILLAVIPLLDRLL